METTNRAAVRQASVHSEPTPAEHGTYIASESSFHRVLLQGGRHRHRGRAQGRHRPTRGLERLYKEAASQVASVHHSRPARSDRWTTALEAVAQRCALE